MNIQHLEQAKATIRYGSKRADPRLIVLMGLPGSGKSYIADHLHNTHSFSVLSGENVTHAIFGTEQCTGEQYQQAYEILRHLMKELLDQGYSVVVDGTNLKYEFRRQIYDIVDPKVKKLLIYPLIFQ